MTFIRNPAEITISGVTIHKDDIIAVQDDDSVFPLRDNVYGVLAVNKFQNLVTAMYKMGIGFVPVDPDVTQYPETVLFNQFTTNMGKIIFTDGTTTVKCTKVKVTYF